MRIVIDEKIPGLKERVEAAVPEGTLVALPAAEITPEAVRDADALIVRTRTRCDASLLQGSSVRLVGTATIGLDHIDTEWCSQNGIRAVNAPGCNAPAVMQYVASSLAAVGFDPAIHTLGVVGKGNIGSLVTSLYRSAGAEVIVCDPPRAEAGFTDEDYLPFEQLMARADAVTFHVPLSRSGSHPTLNMLSPEVLDALPSHPSMIVNASRGAVIAPETLAASDSSIRWIIDTWPFEDINANCELGIENCELTPQSRIPLIATPHIAGYSRQGKERATRSMIEALNEEFGLGISAEGLADYSFRQRAYRLGEVIKSYDPAADSAALKGRPEDFETLRNNYKLREEP